MRLPHWHLMRRTMQTEVLLPASVAVSDAQLEGGPLVFPFSAAILLEVYLDFCGFESYD